MKREVNLATYTMEELITKMDQAGVDEDTARKAIEDAEGDLAQAIMNLAESG